MERIDRQDTLPGWLWIAAAILAVAAGALAARGLRRRRGRAWPTSPDRLSPDRLVDIAEQDSFPASDPPGYSMPRTGSLLH